MEERNIDLNRLVAEVSVREKRAFRYSFLFSVIAFVAGAGWLAYSFYQVSTLRKEYSALEKKRSDLETEILTQTTKLNEIKEERDSLEKKLKTTYSVDKLEGRRKRAVELALEVQTKNIPFKMGGRNPEQGGLDLSGFISYILSNPDVGMMKPSEVPFANQPYLMKKLGFVKADNSTLPLKELKPGDLIYWDAQYTMMYLGDGKCIGMLYESPEGQPEKGAIEIKDINFKTVIGYAKLPY